MERPASAGALGPREARYPVAPAFRGARDREPGSPHHLRDVACAYAPRAAAVVARDEPAAGGDHLLDQPVQVLLQVLRRDLVEEGVDVAEASRRLPVPCVPDEEVVSEVRPALLGQPYEALALVQPVRGTLSRNILDVSG